MMLCGAVEVASFFLRGREGDFFLQWRMNLVEALSYSLFREDMRSAGPGLLTPPSRR
jgi:hypothetical protein